MPVSDLDPAALALLRHPRTHQPLEIYKNALLDRHSGERFPIRDGIPSLFNRQNTPPRHRLWRRFYDAAAPLYDPLLALGERLHLGTEMRLRRALSARQTLPSRSHILDVGCGTGASRLNFPATASYVGLDFSRSMLRRAQHKSNRQGLPALWLQADAAWLPLASQVFDLILCMGVLQHLVTPARAITEMLRVCAPGGRLFLLDEAASGRRVARRLLDPYRGSSQPTTISEAIATAFPGLHVSQIDPVPLSEYYALELTP